MKLNLKKPTTLLFFLPVILFLFSAWFYLERAKVSPRERDREEEKDDNPRKWQEWFNKGRRSPDRKTGAFHRLKAFQQKQFLPLARPGFSPGQSLLKPLPGAPPLGPLCDWTEMGPSPEVDQFYGKISGRVVSLVLDMTNDPTGNTLYVGTAYGGVWKTTNGLAAVPTFVPISDQTQSLAMGSIALDTSVNPPAIYVGTGELNMSGDSYYGVGILRSLDGGGTWNLVSTANSGAISFLGLAFSKILVDPSSPSTVLAAAGFACCHDGVTNLNQGLYRSTDQGASWTQVAAVNGGGQAINGHSFTDVIDDGSGNFYASVRFQGIYKSTDHGGSWTQLSSPFPSNTAPDTSNFARASLVFRGGTLFVLAADSNENISKPGAGDTGLSQSTDGGSTWQAVNLPGTLFGTTPYLQGTYDQYVAAPPGSTALLAAGIDLFKANTVNGTSTVWTNLTNAYTTGYVHPDQHASAMVDANNWYIGNDGGVWTTSNAGATFTDINNNLGTIQFYSASPDPSASGAFLGGTQDNGTPYTGGGVTWSDFFGGDGGYTDVNPGVPGQFYAEYFNVGLYRVDNFGPPVRTVVGTSTIPDNSAIVVPFKVIPGSSPQVVMGTSRIWKGPGNANNGGGWGAISGYLTGNDFGSVINLDVAPSNSNFIYATTDNGSGVYQVYSNGGGATWSNVSTGLPSANPLVGITVDPLDPQKAYVGVMGFSGGAAHVFETTNGGGLWTDITGNLPDAPINWLLVDPQFPTDLYAANDVGVFATQNNGASWARMGTLLPDSTVLQIKMSLTCPRAIVAATHGRGAWSICPLSAYVCPSPTVTPTRVPGFSAVAPVVFPNPYPDIQNPGAPPRLLVTLGSASDVTVRIFTEGSRKVRDEIFTGVPAGPQTLTLDLTDKTGTPLANSLYYLAVDTNKDHYILKYLIIR